MRSGFRPLSRSRTDIPTDLESKPSGTIVTSFDVAALAGVSQSTVSRALRGLGGVNRETMERVARAAEQLGYQPDARAANLRTASTGSIAVVLLVSPDLPRSAVNPFYLDLVGAIEAAAARRGFNVLLSFQDIGTGIRCDFEQRRIADGTIVIGSVANAEAWSAFATASKAGRRVVGWGAPADDLPTVRADNRAGGALAVEHLIAQGARRLAFVGPNWESHQAYRERLNGFREALAAHGLDGVIVPAGDTPSREMQGEAAIDWLLAQPEPVDGIFAASDLIALGMLRALRRHGRSVPNEIGVIGFDGIRSATHSDPALTTIEQDVAMAGEYLVALLVDGAAAGASRPHVPVRLVPRGSTR